MGIFLGLIAATSWGISDILARYATKYIGTYRTLFLMQFVGILGLTSYLLMAGGLNILMTVTDWQPWAWGILVVICNTISTFAIYRSFEVGVLSVVSPIASSYSAVTIILSLIEGVVPSLWNIIGIVVILSGILLATMSLPDNTTKVTIIEQEEGDIPRVGLITSLLQLDTVPSTSTSIAEIMFPSQNWTFAPSASPPVGTLTQVLHVDTAPAPTNIKTAQILTQPSKPEIGTLIHTLNTTPPITHSHNTSTLTYINNTHSGTPIGTPTRVLQADILPPYPQPNTTRALTPIKTAVLGSPTQVLNIDIVSSNTQKPINALTYKKKTPIGFWNGVGWAVLAAISFGVTFWLLGFFVAPSLGNIIPIWIIRVITPCLLFLCAPALHQSLTIPRGRVWWFIGGVGILDTAAYVAYTFGISQAQISLVTIIASLYSVVTVILAWFFLHESLRRSQWVGVFLVLLGILLIHL